MAIINQDDLIQSVADALQYISFYHPVDYITNLARAYELEQSHAAKDAMAQILINSRLCFEGHRPICQDTGIVTAFVKVGMTVQWEPSVKHGMMTMQQMVDEGVRRAWKDPDNTLRPSLLRDPAFTRRNTGDNTPAMVVVELVEGDAVDVTVAAKGGGSEAKSRFALRVAQGDVPPPLKNVHVRTLDLALLQAGPSEDRFRRDPSSCRVAFR
jgi:fumarate hydratase class I